MYKAIFDKELLKDWCDFCEGRKKFDSYHFSTLLMETMLEGYTIELDEFFKEISKYFDPSIYKNLEHTFKNTNLNSGDIWQWVKKDLIEKKKIFSDLEEASNLEKLIEAQSYVTVHDRTLLDNLRMSDINTILYETSGDYAINNRIDDDRLYALEEVFYNIACDYDLVRGLLAGVINGDVDFSNYLEIYRRGCDYVVGEENIIIYTPDNMKFEE